MVSKCSFPYLALKNDNKIPTLKHITNVGSNVTVKNIYSFPNDFMALIVTYRVEVALNEKCFKLSHFH